MPAHARWRISPILRAAVPDPALDSQRNGRARQAGRA